MKSIPSSFKFLVSSFALRVGRDRRARRILPPFFVPFCVFRGHSLFHVAVLCLLTSVLWQGAAIADQWIIDGRKVVIATDPQAARNFGTNTVYYTTNAVARWIALTNGIALEIHSPTGWVRQVEWTED